ncbi:MULTISPECIES: carbohydrate ABC transporter permease [unclassified Pseudoclavibacter]|uniref:carbohydrate ABC transporter permease n=1 Tax=unclassified Pseudoclavibacter TaxID=2615177 RepID=UPI000CE8CBD0|nr:MULTISPECIES: carbohydrate ABC transporter permease [unclassified Pseudoclavibacter]MBF4551673.1 carbohydrate ABC transporter permease [Pseudoclavibacter sp. VKM Ac-2888]PPG04503.1 sugar ABC transporter permease [Pseudoclavibacter sp. RFBI5]
MNVSVFEKIANYLILGVFGLVILGPISVIVTLAFGPENASVAQEGRVFHWENFPTAWEVARFGQYMLTSVVVAVIVVVVAVLASILAGYALGTMKFRGATPIFYLFLLGIMVPTEAFIVPLYFDLRTVGLTNTVWGVAFPQIAMSIAFGTFWMRTYFRSSSQALIDAAKLDGAGSMRILWQVLVPIGRPAILTLVLLTFMWTWNEFLIPLVMSPNGSVRTAPLGLAFFQGQYTQGTALLAAGAIMVALPVVVLYIFLQRHFIQGMLEGAVRE